MYWLGWRFGVSGLAATLLFLASPMLMINSHLETVDVPGICLWVAAIAAFIRGVDRRKNWLLVVSTILMIMTAQTFFQGLSVLPLALAYLVINKRFRLWNFIPIAAASLFLAPIYWLFIILTASFRDFPTGLQEFFIKRHFCHSFKAA